MRINAVRSCLRLAVALLVALGPLAAAAARGEDGGQWGWTSRTPSGSELRFVAEPDESPADQPPTESLRNTASQSEGRMQPAALPTASREAAVQNWTGAARGRAMASLPAGPRVAPPSIGTTITADGKVIQASHTPRGLPGRWPQSAAVAGGAVQQTAAQSPEPTLAEPTPAEVSDVPVEQLLGQAYQLAGAAESQRDYTQIIKICREVFLLERDSTAAQYANQLGSWALNRRGQIKVEEGQPERAMPDFQAAIRLDPQRWRALHNRGMLWAQAGKFREAFDDFNQTIALNPRHAEAYVNRAALLVVAGDLKAARLDYGRGIELDPTSAVARRGLARVCHMQGRLDEALKHYDAAVRLSPKDAHTITCRADLLTDLGRYAEAATSYDWAIDLDPQCVQAYRSSAWLLATCPDPSVRDAELAVERASTAIHLEGEADALSFDTLAAAQAAGGDFDAAARTARRAIALAPKEQQSVYQDRLQMYEHAQPFRITPLQPIEQATYTPGPGGEKMRR